MGVVDLPRHRVHSGVLVDTIMISFPLVYRIDSQALPIVMDHHSLILNSAWCVGEAGTIS